MNTEISSYEQSAIDFLTQAGTQFKTEFVEFGYHFLGDKEKRNIFNCILSNEKHKYSFKFGSSLNDSCKQVTQPKILGTGEVDIYYGFKHQNKGNVSFGHLIKTTYPVLLAIANEGTPLETLIDPRTIETDFNRYLDEVHEYNKKTKLAKIERPASLDEVEAKTRGRICDEIKKAKEETETVLKGQADEILAPSAYDILASIQKHPVYDFADFCSNYGYDEDSRTAFKTYKAVKREWENVNNLFTEDQLELLREIQ